MKFADDLVDYVIDANLPFSVIQNVCFVKMLENLVGRKITMPSMRAFMKKLCEKFDRMKEKVIDALKSPKYVCITCDVWSSRSQSFLGVTAHFLSETFDRKSCVLAFRQIVGKQSYDVLGKALADIFKEFQIPVNKITHVVTDGGSAFCKAFRIYGKRGEETEEENVDTIDDEEDELNLELPFIRHGDDFFFSNEITFDINVNTDLFDQNYVQSEEENEQSDDSEEVCISLPPDIELPKQRRCASHLLNLVPGDFEKQLPDGPKTVLVTAFSKLHSLQVLCHRSSLAKTRCKEIVGCVLSVACPTRWNSKFDSVNKAFQVKENIGSLIKQLKVELKSARNLQTITKNDWIVIEEYIKVMRPVAVALDQLQSEKNGSQGYIMPTLVAMKHHISGSNVRPISREFAQTMLNIVDQRFESYFKFNEDNRELILAAITLPRFKLNFIRSDDDKRFARYLLTEECGRLSTETVEEDTGEGSMLNNSEEDGFFAHFNVRAVRQNSVECKMEAEVNRFF